LVFDYPTIQAIAEYLDNELFGKTESRIPTQSGTFGAADITSQGSDIADLSDEEVERLLMKKLGNI
jgi:hypothetical protein